MRARKFSVELQREHVMKAKALFVLTLLGPGLCWTITGCGGGSAAPPPPPPPPAPTISSISPTSATVGGSGFTLIVNGSNFVNGSTVRWGGSSLSTTFSTSILLTASIPAADISAGGFAPVTVANPGQGAVSNAVSFEIDNPAPQLSSVSPATVVVGGAGFTLSVAGFNFVSSSVVLWNGNAQPTTFVSGTQLTAAIPASDLALSSADQATITVFNPSPQGGGSNPLLLAINNPQPQVTSLSPSSLQAGAAPFTLTVNGSSLVQGATVEWNGSARATQFVSLSQLIASIPAGDVSAQNTAQVNVFAPPPGGGTSSALPFTIQPLTNNPLPVISSLSDTSAPTGWPGFPLTVMGSNFVAATTGQFNGLNRATSVFSSTLLKSAIPAGDLASAGAAQFNVVNPSPGGGSSNAVNFAIKPVASGAVGVIERSSVATDLTEADSDSGSPAMSADGRFVAFTSNADNLVPGDTNGVADAFLRDTCIGAPTGCTPSVVRVSIATDGSQANQGSTDVAISANGRYIALSSRATNLVPGITSGNSNVFLRDTCFGAGASCTPTTTVVSPNVNDSFGPALSADGRYVTFTNGTPGFCDYYSCSPNDYLAAIHDTCAGVASGCTASTTTVSLANDGSKPNDTNADPQALISADGRFVVFRSSGSNLVAAAGEGGIFLRDTCNGASGCKPSTIRVAVGNSGEIPVANLFEFAMSGNGRFVAFTSNATNVVPGDTNGSFDVFVEDTCIGASAACTPSTARVSLANDGSQSNADSHVSSLSADGRIVAFSSHATNLVANDTSPFPKIFVRDTCVGVPSGCTPSTIRLSVALDGTAANNQCFSGAVSGDGAYVAFSSLASNLGPGDTNQAFDIFVARTGLP
jgi:hypothetical protein